jgi:GNAT superfamily N-acetyltransferase
MERQTESYTWKFRDNPDGDPVVAVAEDNGKIVGQYALWPTKLRLGSVVVMGAQSLDTMTHPDYRGQGMFPQLAEACMQYAAGRGIQVLYGFPNENSFPGFVRKLDWDCTGNIPIWVRPLRPSRHHRMPRYLGSLADYGAKLLPKGRIHGLRVEMSLPDSDAIGGLLEVWRSRSGRCRVERTYERYMWRFSAKSGMRYRWMCAYDGDSLVAVGVWGIDIRNGNALLSEVLGKSTEAIEAVVSACVRMAAKSDCPIMLAISNCPDTRRALSRTGFIKRGEIPLIVRKITTQTLGANVHTHPLWDIFGADLDTF